ncbi:MAG: hypothetical protein EOP10_09120 [Proteobacteria bacterium]|nr:MAG: hypothetical protein EOP10_09120 [Pseudomonadota bacterium]
MVRLGNRLLTLLAATLLCVTACQKKSSSPNPGIAPPTVGLTPETPQIPLPNAAEVSSCRLPLESSSTDQTCEVTYKSTSGYTYIEGTMLFSDGIKQKSSLIIDPKGLISCTGCDCLAEAKTQDATRISCPNGLISPALINGHDHLTWANVKPQSAGDERFEHRNDWRGGKRGHKKITVPSGGSNPEVAFGEIRQLMVGTVSIAGSNSVAGFARNLDNAALMEGLSTTAMDYETFPLEGGGDYDFRVGDCAYSRQPALAYLGMGQHLMHVAEGIDDAARNEFLCLSGAQAGGFDGITTKNTIIHGIGLSAREVEVLHKDGTAVIWSPRSNISLYGNTATVPLMKNEGVNVALGTDWVPSGSAHLLREAQCALNLSDKYWNKSISDQDIWQMMTSQAAAAMKVEQQIGRLAKGLIADIAIYRDLKAANAYRSIMQAEAKDTALVLRGGVPLYGDQALLKSLAGGESCQALDVCGSAKAFCYSAEAKDLVADGLLDLQSLVTKMGTSPNAYPLYFCEAPKDEPTCEPSRKGEYAGITAEDQDGDGVVDAADNCPRVFNPIRPMDQGKQADADGDGAGDSCDLCPLGDASCETKLSDDRDQDGLKDIVDNCPLDANPLQEDTDRDGSGDVCDPCALVSNPGFGSCKLETMSTFNSSRDEPLLLSSLRPAAPVEISGVVTAISKTGYYIQDEAGTAGVFVYLPKGDKPKVGQRLELKAVYDVYLGEVQIKNPTLLSVVDGPLPTAQTLSTEALMQPAVVGLLVTVEGMVSDKPSTGVFNLDGAVNVGNNFALSPAPTPLIGDTYKVTGILRRSGTENLVEPRTLADITLVKSGNPRVKSLNPSVVYTETSSGFITPMTLTLDRPSTTDVVVSLESGNPLVKLPASLIVPANTLSIAVTALVANPVTVTTPNVEFEIKARLGSSEVKSNVILAKTFVPKPQNPAVSELSVWVGLSTTVELALDLPESATTASKIIVTSSDGLSVVRSPLKSGEQSLRLEVSGLNAGTGELRVSVNGSEKIYQITIRKQDLTLTEIFYDPSGDDTNLEWIEIRNTSGRPIDLSGYNIGSGGVTYKALVYPLKGVLPIDGCIVVGGPLSNEKNFNPTLFQSEPFKGGLQNGGVNVDAIGLFFGEITAESIPIDVFAYGETNKDNFLGKDGKVLKPDLPLVLSGRSAERQGLAWIEQAIPTPGNCQALTP